MYFLNAAIIILVLSPNLVFATTGCRSDQFITINSIKVSGNLKTNKNVIEREIKISLNNLICEDEIQESLKRIQRTGLFSNVDYELTNTDKAEVKSLEIKVVERWTTIPILKVNSGGGVSQYTLGVYDPNVFGEYLEMGAQYENLAGTSSGVLWFKNPRLFDQNQGIDLQYWNTKRIRIKYNQDNHAPEIKSGFLHEREKVYADYFREFSRDHVIRVSLDYNKDQFSTDFLPRSVAEKNGPSPILPISSKIIISKIGYELGRINGDPHMLDGSLLGLYLGYAHPLNSNVNSFVNADLSFNTYKLLTTRWQFAQRFLVGSTTTDVLQYWHYLGGLDRIRGFADNRFSGRHYGLSNSELRYLIKQKPTFLIQTASFIDFTSIGDKFSDLNQIHAASIGVGARIILPKFYRFIVRLDYAKPIIKRDDMNFSLGVQQFF